MAGTLLKVWFSFVGILAVADNSSSGNESSGDSEEMSACALAVMIEVMACERRLTSSHSTSSRFAPLNLRLKRQLSNASGNGSAASSGDDDGDDMTAKMCTPGACQDKFSKMAECTGNSEDEVMMIMVAKNPECMCKMLQDWDPACKKDLEDIGADVCNADCEAVACEVKTACASATDTMIVDTQTLLDATMETHKCPCAASVVVSSAALVKPVSVVFFVFFLISLLV